MRQTPRRLIGEASAGDELAALTATDPKACREALQRFLLKGAALYPNASSRFPIFAFRLHQFFTRGDTVWATIEPEAERHLELSKQVVKPGEPDKPLFPLVFCRHCGTAYYRVKQVAGEHGNTLVPREDRREEGDDGKEDAYVYLSASSPWPRIEGPELLERLPAFLKETSPQGVERVRADCRKDLPVAAFVDPTGRLAGCRT